MAEKPILFNTEMVRAILAGRKTVTRRIIKTSKTIQRGGMTAEFPSKYVVEFEDRSVMRSPIQPGDILWVRETWAKDVGRYMYRANYSDNEKFYMNGREIKMVWRPSIHMPREAARLFLRVNNVRIERLQDITARDAFNEGTGELFLEDIAYSGKDYGCGLDDEYGMAREQFAWLWDSTIKKPDLPRYGWEANPWVWVIEFERCDL